MKDNERRKARRRRSKENIESDNEDVGPSLVRSRSFIVPGNPLAPHNIANWERHVENVASNGGRHNDPGARTSMSRMDRYTPARLGTLSRMETPARLGTPNVLKPFPRKPTFLPGIDKKYLSKRVSPEIPKQFYQLSELEMPEGAKHIQTTTSAVSFTLFYDPPRRLAPIPRYYSDEAGQRGRKHGKTEKPKKTYRVRSPKKVYRSGGATMDNIRQGVDGSRRQRDRRNMAVTMAKLQELEDRATHIGTPDMTSRVNEVRATQDQIREQIYLKTIGQFISNRKHKDN